jgi:hypothetical protein
MTRVPADAGHARDQRGFLVLDPAAPGQEYMTFTWGEQRVDCPWNERGSDPDH